MTCWILTGEEMGWTLESRNLRLGARWAGMRDLSRWEGWWQSLLFSLVKGRLLNTSEQRALIKELRTKMAVWSLKWVVQGWLNRDGDCFGNNGNVSLNTTIVPGPLLCARQCDRYFTMLSVPLWPPLENRGLHLQRFNLSAKYLQTGATPRATECALYTHTAFWGGRETVCNLPLRKFGSAHV